MPEGMPSKIAWIWAASTSARIAFATAQRLSGGMNKGEIYADAGRHMPRLDFGRNTSAKTLRLAEVAYPEKDSRAPRCVWRIKTEWGGAQRTSRVLEP